jgi:hypothetical protein
MEKNKKEKKAIKFKEKPETEAFGLTKKKKAIKFKENLA